MAPGEKCRGRGADNSPDPTRWSFRGGPGRLLAGRRGACAAGRPPTVPRDLSTLGGHAPRTEVRDLWAAAVPFRKPEVPAPTEGRTGLTPPPAARARRDCAATPTGLLRDPWRGPLLFCFSVGRPEPVWICQVLRTKVRGV